MNQKIKEIYINNEISKRYLTETNCNNNINLIKKIYENTSISCITGIFCYIIICEEGLYEKDGII